MSAIRVLLVDDHAVVRTGYRMLLEQAGFEIVAEADSGELAGRLFQELRPDVVVMDLSLPGISGIEAVRRLIARDPDARILVFSMHEDPVFIDQAVNAGARGYISKRSAPDVMVQALRAIAGGGVYIEAGLAQELAFRKIRDKDDPFAALTTREFEICTLLAQGCNTGEIARRLSLSYKTVANYSTQIKGKLGVGTTAELARLAIRHRIIEP